MTTHAERVQRENKLLDLAKARPDGFTKYDAAEHLGCSVVQVKRSIHDLRMTLEADAINLAYEPVGARYHLVGSWADSGRHRRRNLRDLHTRVTSNLAFARSILNGTTPEDEDYPLATMYVSSLEHTQTVAKALRMQAGADDDLEPMEAGRP